MRANASRKYTATGLAVLLSLGTVAAPATPASAGRAMSAPAGAAGETVALVVRADTAARTAAARAWIQRNGGAVKRDLGVIGGFSATVPAGTVAALQARPGVSVTADSPLQMKTDTWLNQVGATDLEPVIEEAGGDDADHDNPDDGYRRTGVALTGAGVGVAVIDSGVSPVPALAGPGKVIHGPDLSFESQTPNLHHLDTYGHGTHMAGIIAGQDPADGTGTDRFDGVAPGARIISVKVAAADGATDVSQVIAAIDWVVAHRDDPDLDIRVLNLSFGTDSTQSSMLDPLAFAVEQAWAAGIVVVVSAGNDGTSVTRLTMPAADPDVIAVGAADTRGTDDRSDDVVADFTNRGNAERHVDVLAAGKSIVSLRVPGSYIDTTFPSARLSTERDPAQRFFRGSGTSQAAAVVSGAVALLLQQRPGLTPDQVKAMLMTTADPIADGDPYASGAGQINIGAAARLKTPKDRDVEQLNVTATGLGSLEESRGGTHVYDPANDAVLDGEQDIFGKPWNAATWSLASRTRTAWSGGSWNGSVWTGSEFDVTGDDRMAWAAVPWTGRSWAGVDWAGRSWANAYWNGRSWASDGWAGRSWAGRSWASAVWAGDPWQ
ncbi:MAG TPA: S8 family serine peptidase [Actinoplanes sp.]|nr:S8 family serine peptidase [Actinoplanes sp.]